MSESKIVEKYLDIEVSELQIRRLYRAVKGIIRGISCTCVLMEFSEEIEDKHCVIELLESESFECYVVKGFSYWRCDDDETAKHYLDLAVAINDCSDVALSIRASLSNRINPKRLNDSYRAYSLNSTIRNLYSLSTKFQGKEHDSLNLAKHFYKKLVSLKYGFTCAHRHYANYLKDKELYKRAIKVYKIVISQETTNQAYYNLWYCYNELGSDVKSLMYAKMGKMYRPNDSRLDYALACSYLKHKDFPKSIQCFQSYLKSHPNSDGAKRNLETVMNTHRNHLQIEAMDLIRADNSISFINHVFKVKLLKYSLNNYKELYSTQYLKAYKPSSTIDENNDLVTFFVEASKYTGTDEKKKKLKAYSKDMSLFNLESLLHFGKHKGSTVIQIIDIDPDYILWCLINLAFFYVDYEVLINEQLRGHTYYLKAIEYNLAKHFIQDNSLIEEDNSFASQLDYSSYDSRPSYEESLRDALDGNMDAYWNID